MAKVSIATLKGWFMTAMKPTQAQFHSWLDSFWHKDASLPIASVDTLQAKLDAIDAALASVAPPVETTINGSGTITVPAGKLLDKVVLISSAAQTIMMGTGGSAASLLNETYAAGEDEVITLDLYGEVTIDITCNNSVTLKQYFR